MAEVKDRETLISLLVRGTAAMQEANFVADSLLEGRRFEPPVPPEDGAFQNSILSIPQAANRLETELPRPERDRGFESPYLRQRLRLTT